MITTFMPILTTTLTGDSITHPIQPPTSDSTTPPPISSQHATQEIGSSDLGIDNMSITVPADAVSETLTITAREVELPEKAPAGYKTGGKVIDITSTPVSWFISPITVTMPTESNLISPKVYYWDGSVWKNDGITLVSYNNSTITFTTTHFTIFTAFAVTEDNKVRFGPNPYNPNNGTARIWYVLDSSADTTIYIIDTTGKLVWKNSYQSGINGGQAGENNVEYDGKTSGGYLLGNGAYLYKIVQGSKVVGGGRIAVIK